MKLVQFALVAILAAIAGLKAPLLLESGKSAIISYIHARMGGYLSFTANALKANSAGSPEWHRHVRL